MCTLGKILSVIGIALEGGGIIYALKMFGSPKARREKDMKKGSLVQERAYLIYEKEGIEFKKQIFIIILGLIFQIIGLFIP